jgi:hypothetical protein
MQITIIFNVTFAAFQHDGCVGDCWIHCVGVETMGGLKDRGGITWNALCH